LKQIYDDTFVVFKRKHD